jgi:hypothetical protein
LTSIKTYPSAFLVALLVAACSSNTSSTTPKNPDAGNNAAAPSVSVVTADCGIWCGKSVQHNCPYTADAGTQAGCELAECDYSRADAPCLKLAKAYYDCVIDSADVCNDCLVELDSLEICH